jgi:peptide/nickel transport system permease protein
MARFLVRRILQGAVVMWLVTVLVFGMFFIGGGPASVARRLAGKEATPQSIDLIRKRLLLDKPLTVQYLHFLGNLLHGNLGYSYIHGQSVTSVIARALPVTLSLVIGAAVLWLAIGIVTGVVSAVRRGSVWDRMANAIALFFYSMPVFVLGLLLQFVFYFEFTIHGIYFFPAPGYTSFATNPTLWFRGLILPWITLAMVSAAVYTRLTRGSMLDVMREDYIRTARSKGLSERRVIYRHGLRSALTPIVSQFGIDVGTLLGGAILTEWTFGMPGLGYTAVVAIEQQDLPVIIGIVIVAAAAVVVANIAVDVVYALLDPRVRLH